MVVYLTPREFARRVGLSLRRTRELLRRRLVPGATTTATRRWRIPEAAVVAFAAGHVQLDPAAALTVDDVCDRLWLQYEGRPHAPAGV